MNERDLEQLESAVRFNTRCTTLLLALLVVLVAGTVGYAYWKVRQVTRPDYLVQTAEQQIKARYPAVKAELKEELTREVPALTKGLSRRGLTTIPQAREQVERYVQREAEVGLDRGLNLSAEQFRKFVRDNKEQIRKGFDELREAPKETKGFVLELEKRVDAALGTDIRQQARRALAFLHGLRQRLAKIRKGEDLSPAQQSERDIARILRALQEREGERAGALGGR